MAHEDWSLTIREIAMQMRTLHFLPMIAAFAPASRSVPRGLWRDRHKSAIAPECRTLASSGREGAKLSWEGICRIAEPNRLTISVPSASNGSDRR
jgi:hypothetical protein